MFIGLVTCCYALLPVVTSFRGENVSSSKLGLFRVVRFPGQSFQIIFVSNNHEYLVTYVHWACYVLLRVVACCHILRGENVCQSTLKVPILYSFPTHEYLVTYGSLGLLRVVTGGYALLPVVTSLEGKTFVKVGSRFPFYIRFQPTNTLLHIIHWACYVLLRVVTCCHILRGENVCQSTFKFPILYSFPTHEYLVACVHSACYVLLHVVTCCFIFRGQKFVKLFYRFRFYIRLKPTNTLLAMFIGLVTCCYGVVTCCHILRGENVCQSTFKVPILNSFPTHEYLVTYGHLGLLRGVRGGYAFLPVVKS